MAIGARKPYDKSETYDCEPKRVLSTGYPFMQESSIDQITGSPMRPFGVPVPSVEWEKKKFVISGYCMPRGLVVLVSIPSPMFA